jgi:hypothetical protein
MNSALKPNLIGTLILPIVLFAVLAPFSLLIGWNLLTALLFWFIIVPLIALHNSTFLKIKGNRTLQAVAGLIAFYAFMVFMIYEHYKTDLFMIMLVSLAINLAIVSVMSRKSQPEPKPGSTDI